jgi:hypothetical protein
MVVGIAVTVVVVLLCACGSAVLRGRRRARG